MTGDYQSQVLYVHYFTNKTVNRGSSVSTTSAIFSAIFSFKVTTISAEPPTAITLLDTFTERQLHPPIAFTISISDSPSLLQKKVAPSRPSLPGRASTTLFFHVKDANTSCEAGKNKQKIKTENSFTLNPQNVGI